MKIGHDGVAYYAEIHQAWLNKLLHALFMPVVAAGAFLLIPGLFRLNHDNATRLQAVMFTFYLGHYCTFDTMTAFKVFFVYGFAAGSTPVPGNPGLVLGIDNAKLGGSAVANGSGVAQLVAFVPNGAAGKTILFQTVSPASQTLSNVVTHAFPSLAAGSTLVAGFNLQSLSALELNRPLEQSGGQPTRAALAAATVITNSAGAGFVRSTITRLGAASQNGTDVARRFSVVNQAATTPTESTTTHSFHQSQRANAKATGVRAVEQILAFDLSDIDNFFAEVASPTEPNGLMPL